MNVRGETTAFEHPQHFQDLDGLRGLLALSVVLLHYGINALVQRVTHSALPGFLFQLSVDFFFVLSGFVLSFAARGGVPAFGRFAIKRAFRLMPVYWVCLGLTFLAAIRLHADVPYFRVDTPPERWLTDLFLWQAFKGGEPLVVPAWSVAWELVLPIIAVAFSRPLGALVRQLAPFLLPIACIGMAVAGYEVARGAHLYPIRAALGLSTGALVFVLFNGGRVLPRLRDTPILAWVSGMLAIMLVSSKFPLLALLFPACAVGAVVAGTRSSTILSSTPAAWLGRISFTLYLVHIPALVAAESIAGPMLSPIAKVATLIAALVAAHLLTRMVELPAMSAGRSLVGRNAS